MHNCPHCHHELTHQEIGSLYAAVGRIRNSTSHHFWNTKLTGQEVDHIRKSKEPIKKLAETYNVSFATIWRIKENITYKSPEALNCHHCEESLTPLEISRLFGTLGGSVSSPSRQRQLLLGDESCHNCPRKILPIFGSPILPHENLQENTRFYSQQLDEHDRKKHGS